MKDQIIQKILSSVEEDRVVSLAQSLVRIPSPPHEEAQLAEHVAHYLESLGIDVQLQDVVTAGVRSKQVIGRLGGTGGGTSLMLCGHLDSNVASKRRVYASAWWTAKEGSEWAYYRPDLWTKEPFAAQIEDGWLYGLGTVNMKGGLAAMLGAAEAITKAKLVLKGDVILAAVMGEIPGGIGATNMVKRGIQADIAIVAECTGMDIVTASVGVCRGAIHTEGRIHHHDPHVNPVEKMCKIVSALGPTYAPMTPGGWMTFEPHPDLPGYPRITASSIHSEADKCTTVYTCRIVPGQNEQTLRKDLEALLAKLKKEDPDLKAWIEMPHTPLAMNMVANTISANEPAVQSLIRWHSHVLGREPRIGAGARLGGAADSGHLAAGGIKAVEYGPGLVEVWPMVDERVRVIDIVNTTRVLALTAADLCA